jgi:hypothetical protein
MAQEPGESLSPAATKSNSEAFLEWKDANHMPNLQNRRDPRCASEPETPGPDGRPDVWTVFFLATEGRTYNRTPIRRLP